MQHELSDVVVQVTVLSRQGSGREENQDRIVVNNTVLASEHPTVETRMLNVPVLVAVFDGLGGHPAGGLAAAVAADAVASGSSRLRTESDVEKLIDTTNRHLYRTMFAYPDLATMGATIAGAYITQQTMTIFHVGDSRVYAYKGGYLTRMTVDDWDAKERIITQVLGGSYGFVPVRTHMTIEPLTATRLLVATDGVFAATGREQLAEAMEAHLEDVPERLLQAAIAAGNTDDFSAAVIEVPAGLPNH